MQAQVTMESGGRVSLGGFMAVSRSKLKALPGDTLADLAATDELELLYLHLQSMRNFDGLRWTPETGQVAKRESSLGTAAWPKVRHDQHTEETRA